MTDVESLVDAKTGGKKVMMFSKTTCPFCSMAKKVFEKLISEGTLSSDDYEVMELDKESNGSSIQSCLGSKTGARTVPRVFVKGNCIGGGDDVVAMDKNGKLKAMLTS